jgi:hypothetical protein
VPLSVTVDTERNQIFKLVVPKLASSGEMMHLQEFRGAAILTSPAVSFEHEIAQLPICLQIEL